MFKKTSIVLALIPLVSLAASLGCATTKSRSTSLREITVEGPIAWLHVSKPKPLVAILSRETVENISSNHSWVIDEYATEALTSAFQEVDDFEILPSDELASAIKSTCRANSENMEELARCLHKHSAIDVLVDGRYGGLGCAGFGVIAIPPKLTFSSFQLDFSFSIYDARSGSRVVQVRESLSGWKDGLGYVSLQRTEVHRAALARSVSYALSQMRLTAGLENRMVIAGATRDRGTSN